MVRLVRSRHAGATWRTRVRATSNIALVVLLMTSALSACRAPTTPTPTPSGVSTGGLTFVRSAGAATGAGGEGYMRLALSQGSQAPEQPARVPAAQTEPLSPEQAQAVLNRLPPLVAQPDEWQQFRLPAETLPAPRAGQTVEQPFPPKEGAEVGLPPAAGPLKVLRYSPEGDVELAPFLSVTFDQPMVPLATQAELAAREVPVRLSPLPEGTWRWLGTKTLVFEPVTRFPMATHYTVEIPAGTVSATGGRLEEKVSWTFTTPPPKVETSYPSGGPQVRDPLLFVAFDQRIDPQAVLATVQLKAAGRTFPLALATPEQVQADETVARLVKEAGEGRWLAFRSSELLPYDTTVTVDVGPGTPSAEGPLTTQQVQSFSFTTYGPLRVVEAKCGWDSECRPMMPWHIRFSNPLDEEAFDESMVRIDPQLPGGKLSIFGETLQIEGRSQGRTIYNVTLKAAIRDKFGQTLGADQTVSFKVGPAEPMLYTPEQNLAVIDPADKPSYSAFSLNYDTLRVRLYAVQPEDWPAYLQYLQDAYRGKEQREPPGRKVLDKQVRTEGTPDALVETPIDLTPALHGSMGHVIVAVDPPEVPLTPTLSLKAERWERPFRVWVQATRIALDAFADGRQVLAWANALSDGKPLADAQITLFPGGAKGRTDAGGLVTFPLPSATGEGGYLVARLGDDVALLPQSAWWGVGKEWCYAESGEQWRWYVFDDRQMYRPGEEVHVKGWVRLVGLREGGGDVYTRPGAGSTVSYSLTDARDNKLLDGTLPVNAMGGFDTSFRLPETMNLGQAQLQLTLHGAGAEGVQFSHTFQVQEFRRPEFEVTASVSEGPHFVGEHATASVEARYYAGGGLADAEVTWNVTSQPGSFRPPNWDDFVFGIWTPWWRMPAAWGFERPQQARVETYHGRTDPSGVHTLRIDFQAVDPPQPTSVTAEATVMDVNRQAWSASAHLLVHPADLYVGLRTARTFFEQGKPIQVDAIVTDLDGKPVSDRPIEMRVVRLDWTYRKGEWREEEVDEQRCTIGSADKPVSCTFQTREGGTYRISATITDGRGRRNLTQLTCWVSGGKRPGANQVEQEEATLIPDRKEYQPGDTAEILVEAPFAPAEGLLTLRRAGIVHSERFHMDGNTYTIRVPIEEAYIPNLFVQVDLVGAAPRLNSEGQADSRLPPRPAFASGSLELSVPPYSRTLALQVTPEEKELEPGGETLLHVTVQDAAGRAVKDAEVAIAVVDEAVLALTGYQLADPVAVFYQSRPAGVCDYHLRGYILLVDPDKLAAAAASGQYALAATGAPEEAPVRTAMPMPAPKELAGAEAQPIRVRTEFNPLAAFQPSVTTDADGHAAIRVKLPDSLTRYRVMAVAVAGDREFGKGESAITARLPLMVRPSPPRFLNFGDRFELPVVVQNGTDQPMQVDVAVRATNVELTGSAGLRLTVPAKDRREVRFAFRTQAAGTARFQVGVASGQWADAAEFSLPVYTPATTEAFATYGTLDAGAVAQPVVLPGGIYTQFGGLEVSTSSTALQALTDAVLYLVSYPFECSEQLASRILAVAALRDVLSAFRAEGLPAPDELVRAVQRDIEALQGMQNSDGGFPIWRRGEESWPYHTIHAAHALARAQQKGFAVPEAMLSSALSYLRDIENKYPAWYGQSVRNTLTAYALYVRAQLGDVDTARARRLVAEAGVRNLEPDALGWLLYVLSGDARSSAELAEMRRYLNNRVVETAGAANFTTSYREQDGYLLLASDRKADGIILEALIRDQPQSDLIPKLVRGLLAHRKQGKWGNTQENVFILLALDKYFQTYEAQTPEFVARAWLGDQYLASFRFAGRTTDYQKVLVPTSFLAEQAQREGEQTLILSKEGPGRLYYRLGMKYAPTNLKLEPLEQGFTVLRRYEAVDDPADVRQDADGVWHVRAGARVRVRLTMIAPSRRYHVALTDPLPAGFEALNPALAVTGSIPQDPAEAQRERYWWWRWTWYEHQNLRDERAEAFASLLWEGVHTYTYVARATTPGQFVVPPPKAEEMYSPEVFGRGATDRVAVEAGS